VVRRIIHVHDDGKRMEWHGRFLPRSHSTCSPRLYFQLQDHRRRSLHGTF